MSEEMEASSASRQEIALRLPKLAIEDGNWPNPNDKLDRRSEIENLTPVLLNAQAPLVLALEAPWGGGKSTFIRLWRQFLTYNGHVSLNLNAWEGDFCDDPLLPLLSVLDDWLSEQREEGGAGKAWKKAKTLAPGLLKASAVAAVKAGTLGALDLDKAVEGAISSSAGEVAGNIVDSFKSKVNSLKRFKELLSKALEALPDNQSNLIIFIDELDRCRPSYAIELLERIKHLFDIERLVFVLAVNREQLGKSLQGVYGPNFDGESYLKRFVDFDYQLRVPDVSGYIGGLLAQPDIRKRFEGHQSLTAEYKRLFETFVWLSERFSYQLRGINQLMLRLRLIIRSIPERHSFNPQILVALLFLREKNSGLYEKFRADPQCVNEVIMFLLGRDFKDGVFSKEFPVVAGVMVGAFNESDYKDELFRFWCEIRDKYSNDDKRYSVAERIRAIAAREDGWDGEGMMRTICGRIELLERMHISA
ncbi:KAP family P-loop NTPase fold protein [Microbulbifer litoralis]|uniref:KAP family P-loop NTPase fold protein n=1 Tax=Microbulbifer litoralis TaxID=2933965 RepID=UPI002028CE82|nr:P-loop NTPase fold protein [Microbulbifer sp. GX H0434]